MGGRGSGEGGKLAYLKLKIDAALKYYRTWFLNLLSVDFIRGLYIASFWQLVLTLSFVPLIRDLLALYFDDHLQDCEAFAARQD